MSENDSLAKLKGPLTQIFSPSVGSFNTGHKIFQPTADETDYLFKVRICSIANKILDSLNESDISSIINTEDYKEASDILAHDERYKAVIYEIEKIKALL